jgi:hypothetical protein
MAILFQLLDLIGQAFAHLIKSGGQDANFVFPIGIYFVTVPAGGNAFSADGEFMERLGDMSGQPKR